MNKTIRYILYVLIIAICIIAIFVGVYALEFKISDSNVTGTNSTSTNNTLKESEASQTLTEFESLFTNEFFGSNVETSNIEKIDDSKEIVYDAISLKDSKDSYYSVDIHIPMININTELAQNYNNITQQLFVDKVNEIMQNTNRNKYTVCNIKFTSYVNNNILSIAILETIKEGTSSQRKCVQTYNYNLETNEEVKINQILEIRGLDTTSVNKKINSEISELIDQQEAMSSSGYEVYQRDIKNEMYDIKNVQVFIQGPNGELYIIYAYGNSSNTSELDVIKI